MEINRYDNAWKDLVRELLIECLDFYYPELSRDVDHTVRPQSRDQELAKLLFQYSYRIFDREGSFPATLLLLTDGDHHFYPTCSEVSMGTGKIYIHFNPDQKHFMLMGRSVEFIE